MKYLLILSLLVLGGCEQETKRDNTEYVGIRELAYQGSQIESLKETAKKSERLQEKFDNHLCKDHSDIYDCGERLTYSHRPVRRDEESSSSSTAGSVWVGTVPKGKACYWGTDLTYTCD
jgi:hypothetical protein